jgi:ABC-type Zn uptake system ZnuABC Zn-binding protein ZnuA
MTKEIRMTNDAGGASGFGIPSSFDIRHSSFTRRQFLRLLPAGALAACSPDEGDTRPKFPKVPWRITSTTHFTADLVREIGGQAVQSDCIVPTGQNPFTFRPAALDLSKFRKGDMVLLHGLGMESRWPEDFAELAKSRVKVETVTAAIPESSILRPSGPAGPAHPCVWMDPALAGMMIESVTKIISGAMPKLAGYFQQRSYRMKLDIEAAARSARAKFAGMKAADKVVFSSHDSLPYFARAFGLEARALTPIDGQIPGTLPAELQEWIRARGVRSMFRESFTEAIPLRNLLAEASVNPDHTLHSLTLPAEGTKGLVAMEEYNVAAAVPALRHAMDLIQYTLATDG